MKQTNNAIKFLMAQYRAIFQNAYFKGLATAAVVTMGLAIGQAQAVENVTNQATWEKLEGNNLTGTVVIDVSQSGVTATNTKSGGFTLSLTGGTNSIAGSGSNAVSLTAEQGTLKLADSQAVLTIGKDSDGGATTLDIKAFDIQEGTVTAQNQSDKATTVKVDSVNIGKKGILNITAADTNLKFGSGDTVYNLAEGSKVNLTKTTWEGDISNASGTTITVKDTSTIKNYGSNVKANIDVTAEKTGTIALANDPQTNKDEESLQLVSGSTIKINGGGTSGAILNLQTGNLSLESGVVLLGTTDDTATNKAGTLKIGGGSSDAVISLNKETLTKFLDGSNDGAKKGVLDIADSGTVLLTDSTVKLGDLAFGDDAAGKIKVASGAKLGGNNVVVDAALTGANDLTVLAKDTLTLGKSGLESAKTNFVAKFETKNLNLVTDEDSFTLQNAVTLKAMGDSKDAEGNAIKVAQDGTIVGKAINVSGGSIKVGAGNYTFGEDVTLTKGSLSVTSAEPVKDGGDKVASSLKLANANVTLHAAKSTSGTIAVTGKNATLDLSEAKSVSLVAEKDGNAPSGNLVIANVSEGTLVLKGEQVDGLVKAITSDKYSSINLAKGGTLEITDSLSIDGSKLKSASTESNAPDTATINFEAKNDEQGGTLKVADTLTLTNLDATAVNISKDGYIHPCLVA